LGGQRGQMYKHGGPWVRNDTKMQERTVKRQTGKNVGAEVKEIEGGELQVGESTSEKTKRKGGGKKKETEN